MHRRIRRAALGVLAALTLTAVAGLAAPRDWRVERSIVIDASSAEVRPWLDDLARWPEWVAWGPALDPAGEWLASGPERGVGGRRAWRGPAVGRGSLEMVESDPAGALALAAAVESDTVNAHLRLSWAPEGSGTRVTWLDEGTMPPLPGGLFRGVVERRLGATIKASLERLKQQVESSRGRGLTR